MIPFLFIQSQGIYASIILSGVRMSAPRAVQGRGIHHVRLGQKRPADHPPHRRRIQGRPGPTQIPRPTGLPIIL